MAYKKWIVSDIDKSAAKTLSEECDIDPFLALIAASRGYDDPAQLDELLSDEPIFASAYELPDIEKAVAEIKEAAANDKLICVFGDYDCDGVTATALLYGYLKEKGINCTYYIPDRFEDGYGMSCKAIDLLRSKGVELIITVDNGISCAQQVEYAKSFGIKTVITDHHLPHEILPDAAAVVDPHLKNSSAEFRDICGVFVAFKLVCALENAEPEEIALKYADLIAIGLVADVMPLKNENRDMVKLGLKAINNTSSSGIIALLNSAGIKRGNVTSGKIAFGISPRLNAAGRMDNADIALKLLLETDFMKASEYAGKLEQLNAERQRIEQEISKAAQFVIEKNGYNYDRIVVVEGENWHKGVIGIVASRFSEKYGKPVIVLSIDSNGNVSGSGRSLEGFSLYEAVSHCCDCLTRFGGHALAAGVGLKRENIEKFRKKINEYAAERQMPVPVLRLDCKLNPAGLSLDLADSLQLLEPFGKENPAPVFAICGLSLERIMPVSSGKHSKLLLSKDGNCIEAMAFGVPSASVPFGRGDKIDIAVTVDANEYMGKRSLSVVIKNWRKSGINDDALFEQINEYESFRRKEKRKYEEVTRDNVGAVYRVADKIPAEAVRQKLITDLGYFKTMIGLDVLYELKLIEDYNDAGTVKIRHITGRSANLADSVILNSLKEGV